MAPVYYHDVNEVPYDVNRVSTRLNAVNDIFWKVPINDPQYSASVNDILGQAGIQLQLVGTGVHALNAGESNNMVTDNCTFAWDTPGSFRYNVANAVDLYSVETFTEWGVLQDWAGYGGGLCRGRGQLAVKDTMYELWDHQDVAILVNHEFGHYLGSLADNYLGNNLMNGFGIAGYELNQSQIDHARLSSSSFVYSDASTDFNKDN